MTVRRLGFALVIVVAAVTLGTALVRLLSGVPTRDASVSPGWVREFCQEINGAECCLSQTILTRLGTTDWGKVGAKDKDRIAQALGGRFALHGGVRETHLVEAYACFDDAYAFERIAPLARSTQGLVRWAVCCHLPRNGTLAAKAVRVLERLVKEPETFGICSVPTAAAQALSSIEDTRAMRLCLGYFMMFMI